MISHYKTKNRFCKFNIKTSGNSPNKDPGFFSGYASVFDEIDSYNDRVIRGAFKDSLADYDRQAKWPKMLWQHELTDLIGIWSHIREDSKGLYVEGQLLLDVQKGREAYSLLRAKALEGLSIGFRILESVKGHEHNTRLITKVDLVEISLVTIPANSQANITNIY